MATTSKTVEEDIQALRGDVAELAKSVSAIVSGAVNGAEKGSHKGVNGAARAGNHFASDAAGLTSHAAEAAEGAVADVTSLLAGEIKRNPFVAVAAALCVGFVAGISQHR
jgi:hypothetical protein